MPQAPIPATVVLIDDHDIVRFGAGMLLQARGLEVAGAADTLANGLQLIAAHLPDVVITDMGLADSQGMETVRRVLAAQLPRPVIVFTMQDELLYGEQALAAGAVGYVMKDAPHESLPDAVHAALSGGIWTTPRLGALLLRRRQRNRAPAGAPQAALSGREVDVLELLKTGRTTKEIADRLGLSARTVDIHRSSIKRKLALRTGAELIAYASRHL